MFKSKKEKRAFRMGIIAHSKQCDCKNCSVKHTSKLKKKVDKRKK